MDRTNIGNAKIAGMADDLKLTSNQYSISLIVFFITYVLFEVPSNLILSRTRPSVFLPIIMILWGIVTCCMALVKDYKHLVALRLLVGILEAGFAPGILLIISSWWVLTHCPPILKNSNFVSPGIRRTNKPSALQYTSQLLSSQVRSVASSPVQSLVDSMAPMVFEAGDGCLS